MKQLLYLIKNNNGDKIMVSIIILASLMPVLILIAGIPLVLLIKERINRKMFTLFILFFALFLNSLLLGLYYYLNLIQRDYNLNLNTGTFFIIEIIFLMGLIVILFSKEEFVKIINENLFDGIILLILLGMIGTILSSNILAIFSSFILIMILMGIIFFLVIIQKNLIY